VTPRLSQLAASTEELIDWMDGQIQQEGLAATGSVIVVVGGMPIADRARTNFLKLHQVGSTGDSA
jgi:pyruvate kinase